MLNYIIYQFSEKGAYIVVCLSDRMAGGPAIREFSEDSGFTGLQHLHEVSNAVQTKNFAPQQALRQHFPEPQYHERIARTRENLIKTTTTTY
jgi:hypothetical protein